MKPSDVSFGLLATTEQDKLLSSPLPVLEDACLRCDSHTVTLFTTCFYGVSIEFDTFFSRVHTFQARNSRTFSCLLLMHCLTVQRYATNARPSVQKQCSRGRRNEHGSHLGGSRTKADRNNRAIEMAFSTYSGPSTTADQSSLKLVLRSSQRTATGTAFLPFCAMSPYA
jgi:hypothetical protein